MTTTTRNCLALLALYVCLVNYAEGATFVELYPEHPAHPGMCYNRQLKRALAVGESMTDHWNCIRLQCTKTDSTPPEFMLEGSTCSYASSLPANCHLVKGDLALDYPACCPRVECDGEPKGSFEEVG